MGLDGVLVLRFGEGLRNLSGEAFAGLLAQDLAARAVVVGHDFRFGCNGEATAPMLAEAGRRLGFSVDVVPPVMLDGERVSSSGVRDALGRGEFEIAKRRLGRPYTMRGRVVPGQRLGRDLGFPTANLRIERRRAPLKGIFAVRVHGIEADAVGAVLQVWARAPQLEGCTRCSRCTCSILRPTFTAGRSKWSSWRSCVTRSTSRRWRRSSSRFTGTPRRRGAY